MKVANSQKRIKELLEYFDISQAEFCKRTGLSKSTVSLYINGKREPMQDNLGVISRAFNIDPAWLMGYDVGMAMDEVEEGREFMIAKNEDEMYVLDSMRDLSKEGLEKLMDYLDMLTMKELKRKEGNGDSEEKR